MPINKPALTSVVSSSKWVCVNEEGTVVNCPKNLNLNSRPENAIEVHFINIGPFVTGGNNEGESILIRTYVGSDQEKNVLYDAGTPVAGNYVLEYLEKVGVSKLDAMIASHPHYDHAGGFIAILTAIRNGDLQGGLFFDNGFPRPDQKFYEEYSSLLQELGGKIKYKQVESKMSIRKLNDERSKFLLFVDTHFKRGEDAPGFIYKSVLLKITYNESTFLFTGDTRGDPTGKKKKSEYRIVQEYGDMLRSDVMKASEHGSNNGNTDTLLDVVHPGIIGISAKFGGDHPDRRATDRFDARGILWFSTNRDKTFIIRTDGIRDNSNNNKAINYNIELGINDPE